MPLRSCRTCRRRSAWQLTDWRQLAQDRVLSANRSAFSGAAPPGNLRRHGVWQTVSTITDKVVEGVVEWQHRPLDSVIFIDAIHVEIPTDRSPTRRSISRSPSRARAAATSSGVGPLAASAPNTFTGHSYLVQSR